MQSRPEYPINAWRQTKDAVVGSEKYRRTRVMHKAMVAVDDALIVDENWDAWSADRSKPVPDLVAGVSWYGYARLLVHDWDEFPILPKPGEEDVWRMYNLGANLYEFHDLTIAGVAGGWLRRAVRSPTETGWMVIEQLAAKSARLIELANKPVEWYTPGQFTQEQRWEEEDSADNQRLHELFDLYGQLVSFQYGLPKLRTIALMEENPELGLPSRQLFNALEKVDLNLLYGQLAEVEDKLKPILRFLATKNYSVADETAPESFWWRHWKPEKRSHQQPNRPPHKK
jgi:hypothetical protein